MIKYKVVGRTAMVNIVVKEDGISTYLFLRFVSLAKVIFLGMISYRLNNLGATNETIRFSQGT